MLQHVQSASKPTQFLLLDVTFKQSGPRANSGVCNSTYRGELTYPSYSCFLRPFAILKASVKVNRLEDRHGWDHPWNVWKPHFTVRSEAIRRWLGYHPRFQGGDLAQGAMIKQD